MKHEVIALANDVQNELPALEQAITVIDLLVDSFGLDNLELTENQKADLAAHHEKLYNALALVRNIIYDSAEKIERITENAGKETNVA